jgi:hypothetical protein
MTFVSGVFLLRGGASAQLNPCSSAIVAINSNFSMNRSSFLLQFCILFVRYPYLSAPSSSQPTPPPPLAASATARSLAAVPKSAGGRSLPGAICPITVIFFKTASRFNIFIICVFQAKKREKAAAASSQKETTGTFSLRTKTHGFTHQQTISVLNVCVPSFTLHFSVASNDQPLVDLSKHQPSRRKGSHSNTKQQQPTSASDKPALAATESDQQRFFETGW